MRVPQRFPGCTCEQLLSRVSHARAVGRRSSLRKTLITPPRQVHLAPDLCRRMCLVALDFVTSEGGLMIAAPLSRFALIVALIAALAGNTLVVGDLRHPNMLGIDAKTGELRWMTQVHPDPKGIMTGSPVLAGDTIYTGVSASGAAGPNATFRGAIVALHAQTGRILWRSYSLPDNGGVPGGYASATMFSPPAVHLQARLLYAT